MPAILRGASYPRGFRVAGLACGVKRSGRPDLAAIVSDRGCAAAGVFTTNAVRAAPVILGTERLLHDPRGVRGVLSVSGVANAMTGLQGVEDNRKILAEATASFGLPPGSLLPACTGVIGRRIPTDKVLAGIPRLSARLGRGARADLSAARAILTTDTRPKQVALRGRLRDGTSVHVGGIAKGSGMIAPRMARAHATTLGFLTTDATVEAPALASMLEEMVESTFNMVSVDGDMSTNDTIYVLSNGAAGGARADDDLQFRALLSGALESLARQVAADGEGATKLLTVTVRGAHTTSDARSAARSVVGSTLVKAAIFGADPNVGRIACALGYSGARLDPDRIEVSLRLPDQTVPLIVDGHPASGLDNGGGKQVRALLRGLSEVPLDISLHAGRQRATAWGCDLSYSYVRINAEYHT